jgi:hypothetical protein
MPWGQEIAVGDGGSSQLSNAELSNTYIVVLDRQLYYVPIRTVLFGIHETLEWPDQRRTRDGT